MASKKSGDYFIKVETETPIQNLTDSISTDFKKIILSDAKEIYIGGNAKDIKSDYTLKMDGKEYTLNNYQKKKNLLQ